MAGVACDLIKRGWTDEQIRVTVNGPKQGKPFSEYKNNI